MNFSDGIIESDFLIIPDDTNYWFVRAGTNAEFFIDFRTNNFVAIGYNEIELQTLTTIPERLRETDDILKNEYKRIFNESYLSQLMGSDDYKHLSIEEKAHEVEKVKRSSSRAASKAFSFVEKMNIGDYILVPNKKSEKLLLGIIISDVFNTSISHEDLGVDHLYEHSDYKKKRRIYWIKEIAHKELPESLMWIQHGQGAIFNITDQANEINYIIANEYIYKENIYLKAHVGTHSKINSTTWLNYQLVINKNALNNADELYQKNKVQSIGHTIFEVVIDNWETIILVGAALFSDVDYEIKGLRFKTHGPLSFLVPGAKKRREILGKKNDLELKRDEEELKGIQLDNEGKMLDNQTKKIEISSKKSTTDLDLQKAKKVLEEYSDLTETTSTTNKYENLYTVKSPEEKSALEDMKISQKPTGIDISPKMQRVIRTLENTEPERD